MAKAVPFSGTLRNLLACSLLLLPYDVNQVATRAPSGSASYYRGRVGVFADGQRHVEVLAAPWAGTRVGDVRAGTSR